MNNTDRQYMDILGKLMSTGELREGRNGRTYSLFGEQMRFDLSEGFPLLTTKKVHFKSILVELLWFLRGDTNVDWLHQHGVTIWDEWTDKDGDLGPVYGKQWRSWPDKPRTNTWIHGFAAGGLIGGKIDQIANLIIGLRNEPYSRRHIVTAWNPADIDDMALPPCHCFMQFHVGTRGLSCHLYQRSADWFLGVPFNIASYALLTHLIAHEVGLGVADLVMSFGDLHLYENHVDQAVQQLQREPRELPNLALRTFNGERGMIGLFDFLPADIEIVGYDPHPAIKAQVSA